MKKALLALLLASLLPLAGCISSEDLAVMRAKFAPDDAYTQNCQHATGTNIYGRGVERSIGLDVVLTEGYVDVAVKDQNKNIVYQATIVETTTLVVEVPERGMYNVYLDLYGFTGSYTIDWSN